ncbi:MULTISPECIES: WXG100 family type VII secretion target [unclassified Crossiella]|uniref:WXG100 family type VII secretion target n=1 Tax=unclassified Crossiella TaxID=2620835 RepID=UPI001FFED36E|nr:MULTISPECIES: hypothetical protein [unclassified Crossiella]MCK2242831.1 hypothetical protein [Crossiella sp. S99.2]MCK2256708.1 hypothetical protein [Crossiella sp. S99.1]
MAIAEPADTHGLWTKVKAHTGWPDTDEVAMGRLAEEWAGAGTGMDQTVTGFKTTGQDVHSVWLDQAGEQFGTKLGQTQRLEEVSAGMSGLSAKTAHFAEAVGKTKTDIAALIETNIPLYGQLAQLPGWLGVPLQQFFVSALAGTINSHQDAMASSIAASALVPIVPLDERRPLDDVLRDYQVVDDPNPKVKWPGFPLSLHVEPRDLLPSEVAVLERLTLADQIRAGAITLEVEKRSETEFTDPTGLGDGHRDAFRHVYLNARLAREIGDEWTRDLGIAHERGPGTPATREAMDLHNNDVGRTIGLRHPDAPVDQLAGYVREAVRTGSYTDAAGVTHSAPIVVHDRAGNLAYSDTVRDGEHRLADEKRVLPGRDPGQVGRPGG